MVEKEFGPLRSRASRKPWPECPDIVIYSCYHCNRLYQGLAYEVPQQEPVCCDVSMERLKPLSLDEVLPEINVDYQIVGGHNQNAVQVFWETTLPSDNPEWVLLKTFSGGYMKYVTSKKRPPMVFPLADEDAYVYCDESPCLQCVFRCKRGFIIYVYIKSRGLIMVPLEKMSARY
ncbi:hypothetical protein [Neobacillus sp. LXY-4]|uniref:hypothetical protein n=1 Tax=Neobacillus sp. LXY-4 TaxID=3379826 RepID=UPI003EE29306